MLLAIKADAPVNTEHAEAGLVICQIDWGLLGFLHPPDSGRKQG